MRKLVVHFVTIFFTLLILVALMMRFLMKSEEWLFMNREFGLVKKGLILSNFCFGNEIATIET